MKNQSLLVLAMAIFVPMCSSQAMAAVNAAHVWTWDSGTTEGWTDATGGTIVSVVIGRSGTSGLGAEQPTPYIGALYPKVKIEGQSIDPGALVGDQFGDYLVMTGEIYVDVNRQMNTGHGDYLYIWIYGENSKARFNTYPYKNMGSIEDLGDGWFRHHLSNRGHWVRNLGGGPGGPDPIGMISMAWNWNYNATGNTVKFDNLTIIPEQTKIEATVDIDPDTLNLKSKGNWITCYILLPEDYNVTDIDPNSVFLEGEIKGEELSFDEQKQVAIAKFSREELRGIISTGEVELTISGQLKDGTIFEGTDVIRVVNEGRRKD